MTIWLMLACAGAPVLPALAPPEAEVEVRAVSAKVDAGQPVLIEVSAWSGTDWVVEPGVPQAEGLTTELVTAAEPVASGSRQVRTWTYALTGETGSYVITTGEGHAKGPEDQSRTFEPVPIFVDIGVPGPTGGPMDGFADVPPPPTPPWGWIAALISLGVGLTVLVLALVFWWKRPRPEPVLPPIPADVAAKRAWATAQQAHAADELDDHGLALALSQILRRYLEELFGWPATKRTTNELLELLEHPGPSARSLGVADRMRTSRILDATDRLKFAREGGGSSFFEALDDDFVQVIAATRPGAAVEVPHA